jgi:hypothetical protein
VEWILTGELDQGKGIMSTRPLNYQEAQKKLHESLLIHTDVGVDALKLRRYIKSEMLIFA